MEVNYNILQIVSDPKVILDHLLKLYPIQLSNIKITKLIIFNYFKKLRTFLSEGIN
jgi:hypothetical protein